MSYESVNTEIVDDEIDAVVTTDTESSTTFNLEHLPVSFKTFLEKNQIDPKIYTIKELPRFVRVNTHLPLNRRPSVEDLRSQLKTDKVYPVEGLEDFFSIYLNDTKQRISDIPAYKERSIFGIDVSSAIAVKALQIEKDDQILDMCCAPGAKLCMIANLLGRDGTGTATGVDIAHHRLSTCRSLIKKYKVGEKLRLFEADSTTFAIRPPSRLGNRIIEYDSLTEGSNKPCDDETDDDSLIKKKRQKTEYLKPFYASKMLRFDDQQMMSEKQLYNKVLVDAECTHDGSILHILKVNTTNVVKYIQLRLLKTFCAFYSMRNGDGTSLKRTSWIQKDYQI
ncbi:S-adenosyl-L-methionine-dependent methyltransferase [Mycotypha africana]|uniref:S-adenosyl-L-methionine-dependent methyltransferase n=1 Tax=Mycotypha africana TaxID=64632 RepID=UPI002301FA12|nr:S-adenosyl-L-methionine-dependent methyltransferase [Mycotypha africana]KAI8987720.1 S-adenosyl-L-methionine-dependent methyltransferase [Mycotypha africana]